MVEGGAEGAIGRPSHAPILRPRVIKLREGVVGAVAGVIPAGVNPAVGRD